MLVGMHAKRQADLRSAGWTEDDTRGPRFERRSHGLYRRAGVDLDLVDARVDDAVGRVARVWSRQRRPQKGSFVR